MNSNMSELLNEIDLIIASIAVFDSKKYTISNDERNKLTRLFHKKLKQAEMMKNQVDISLENVN